MKKPTAEFIGTFTLVFFGCGAAVIAGMGTGSTAMTFSALRSLSDWPSSRGLRDRSCLRLPCQSGREFRRACRRPHDDERFCYVISRLI